MNNQIIENHSDYQRSLLLCVSWTMLRQIYRWKKNQDSNIISLYTLFVVSLKQVKKESFVTISCSTEFLRPSINDDIIYGKGEITNETGSMLFIKGEVFNKKETISTFSGILKRIKQKNK